MWQRFTERARRVILLGQEEAAKMGSRHVGTEHLLLGLVRENEGVAAQVLQKMGLSHEKVGQEIEAEVEPGSEAQGGASTLTPKAKRTLELAADEARRMRHNYIGTEHLLLALLRDHDSLAATVLRKLGLNLDSARTQVMEYLGPETSTRTTTREEHEREQAPSHPFPDVRSLQKSLDVLNAAKEVALSMDRYEVAAELRDIANGLETELMEARQARQSEQDKEKAAADVRATLKLFDDLIQRKKAPTIEARAILEIISDLTQIVDRAVAALAEGNTDEVQKARDALVWLQAQNEKLKGE